MNTFGMVTATIVCFVVLLIGLIIGTSTGSEDAFTKILGENNEKITKVNCKDGVFHKFAEIVDTGEKIWKKTDIPCKKK